MISAAAARRGHLTDPQELFASVKLGSQVFAGVTDATMTHGEGWHFCRLGRKLERADKTSRIVDVKYFLLLPALQDVGTTVDDVQWAAVLRSASAFEMYRKRYGRIAPDRIVQFLLLDLEFPRAIHNCLVATRQSVHAISGTPQGMFRRPVEQLLALLCSELAYAQIDDVIASGLHQYLDELQTKMNQVGVHIRDAFFDGGVQPPQRRQNAPHERAASAQTAS
jgi:uncharacterized alpha-E superfamily protein